MVGSTESTSKTGGGVLVDRAPPTLNVCVIVFLWHCLEKEVKGELSQENKAHAIKVI